MVRLSPPDGGEGKKAKGQGKGKVKAEADAARGRGGGEGGDGGQGVAGLPPHLEHQRGRVLCDMDAPKNTQSFQYAGAFSALGAAAQATEWSMEKFRRDFSVEIRSVRAGGQDLVFDLLGLDPAIANAFRRILLAEVPTMAIEKVFIADNTSVVQDEVLAHRLGLVPLRVDPRHFDFLEGDGLANESNTLVFKLSHRCKRVAGAAGANIHGARVLSSMLEWRPGGSEYPPDQPLKKFTTFGASQDSLHDFASNPPAPTYGDIVLAKLRPGQAIELEAHAVKGIGKTHAKWSPVATAAYRILPEVTLREAVEGPDAEELVRKCPVGVFDIEDVGGVKQARVVRPRDCTLCRECIRTEEWAKRVQLTRVKNHFIFSIESTGSLPPQTLFTEAVKVLKEKASKLIAELS